jgi:hypothetical protein
MSDQDLRVLLRLLDSMDDHFDQKISDQEFLRVAGAALDSLDPSAAHDPGLAVAVRTLDVLLSAARADPLPAEPTYDDLRLALANSEELH